MDNQTFNEPRLALNRGIGLRLVIGKRNDLDLCRRDTLVYESHLRPLRVDYNAIGERAFLSPICPILRRRAFQLAAHGPVFAVEPGNDTFLFRPTVNLAKHRAPSS